MKASTKLMSLLLLVAMCMSFMAMPAYAVQMDESLVVGRVTAAMMENVPGISASDETMVVGTQDGHVEIQGQSATVQQSPAQSQQKKAAVVVRFANGVEMNYDSLVTAIKAASSGDVIVLNTDFSFSTTLNIDKKVTVLLNGHQLKVTVSGVNPALVVSGATLRGGSIVITASEVSVREGEAAPVYAAGITGSLTLDEVNVTYSGPGRMMSASATVFGGSYSSDPSIYLPDGYKAVLNDNGRYVVVEKTEEDEEPAEETPAEETPAEETPAEETPAEETPAEETPTEVTPAEETPAEETPAEETPAEETPTEETPAEETPAEETPAEETPAEETPADETPADETPAEDEATIVIETPAEEQTPVEEQTPAENEVTATVEQTPAVEEKKETLIDQFLNLFETEDPDVDEAAKDIPHSEDKYAADGNTEVVLGPAADDVSVSVSAAENYEDAVLAMAEEDEERNIVWAKDIDVDGELEGEVLVTIYDPAFYTLDDDAKLYHIVNGVAYEIAFTLNREEGSISFRTSSFSPYAITVDAAMKSGTDNSDAPITMSLGPETRVANGDMQTPVTAASPATNFGIILDADTTWNITSWGSVKNLEVQLNGHQLNGSIEIPADCTLTITGTNQNQTVNGSISTIGGNLILTGSMTVNSNMTLNNGSLYIDGSNVKTTGTVTALGSFVQISGGTHNTITGGDGGHITGGTYNAEVPSTMLASGYGCEYENNKWIVRQTQLARVMTPDEKVNFTHDAGNYVEYYKGTTNSSKNYSYMFATTPKDGITGLTFKTPGGATIPLTKGTDYSCNNIGDVTYVSIGLDKLNELFKNVPAGRGYFQFAINSTAVEVPVNIYPDVACDRTTYLIDKFTPITFTLTYAGNVANPDLPSFITVDKADSDNAYVKQLQASDYTLTDNKIVVSTAYLNNLKPGDHNFDFWYDMGFGKMVRLRWTINVGKDYKVTEINGVNMYNTKNEADVNWYQYSGRNLNYTANGDSSKFTAVKVDGKVIASGNYELYTHVAGQTTVGLHPGYLATLPQGKHTIQIVYNDGSASATFSVLGASASPKTGDNNHIGLWVGLLVFSGAAVVALIPKKKKSGRH